MTAKKSKESIKPSQKNNSTINKNSDLYGFLETFFDKHMSWMIWVVLGLGLLISFLLFDSKISLSGDDSAYIMRANDFIRHFKYPSFQGPLYPVVLSPVILIFGVSLIPLKLLSLVSIIAFLYLFYYVFKSKLSSLILILSLLLLSINSYILYYASQTYSEAFYLLLEIVLLYVFFSRFITNSTTKNRQQDIKNHALLASVLLALALTRSVGFSAVLGVFAYFLFTKQWKNLLYSFAAFTLFFAVFQGVKYLLWSDAGLQFSSQGSGLLQKDYYNPQAGNENLTGLLNRLLENTNLYLSKHFMYFVGLRKYDIDMGINSVYSVILVLLSIAGLSFAYKNNKYIFFTGIFIASFLFVSFIVLQSKWDQSRLVIPAVPFLLIILFYGIYSLTKLNKTKIFQFVLPLIGFIMLLQTLVATAAAIKTSSSESGKYGGFTPDWKNYMKASEWVADNLSETDRVACRKPSISFIYGKGREFYGIMQLPNYNTDTFFKFWEKNNSSILVFQYTSLVNKQITQEFVQVLKNNMLALLFSGDTVYLVEYANDSAKQLIMSGSQAIGLNYVDKVEDYKAKIYKKENVNRIYYPDSLLNQLKDNNVTHILTANLRRNNTINDGKIINTVERYQAFIQEKYPMVFTKVVQVGDDDNEPAIISKIEYNKAVITQ